MRRGAYAHPQRTLNPQLREAVRDAMRRKRPSGFSLAILSGCKHQAILSMLLNAPLIAATPLNVERLKRIAELVGFSGELFAVNKTDEPSQASALEPHV